MNEALAEDYMIPMRILSPDQQQQVGQGFNEGGVTDMADWNTQMRSFIARHRRDPATIHTIGFPVNYQVLGAEGKDLVPGELLLQGEDMQLNAMGISPQIARGDLTLQTAPMAARLLESHWQHVPATANMALRWIVEKITPKLGWKEFGVRLTPPKIADNLDHLMMLLQMMQLGEVTPTTILGKLGLERAEEQRRKRDEAILSGKMDIETQAELDNIVRGNGALQTAVQQQQAMMMGGGGAPPPGDPAMGQPPAADPVAQVMARIESVANPHTPMPINDYFQLAQEAAAIFAPMPEVAKRQKLREIDQINKPLADLIRTQMGEFHKQQRQEFISQGQAMAQQGGMPPM